MLHRVYPKLIMDLKKNIEDFDLVFFDLETTGLDAVMGDSICEIGALKMRGKEVVESFQTLVNPKKNMPEEVQRIHGISDKDLEGAPYFEEVVDKFIYFLQDSVILAYNIAFDMKFLGQELKRINYPQIELPAIDILNMARTMLTLPRYKLGAIAQHFNIENKTSHRALEDAACSAQVFFKLREQFREKGINSLADFISLYGFDNDFFRKKESPKISALSEAVDKKSKLNIRLFSYERLMKKEIITPLKLERERNYTYLWYQNSHSNTLRIETNRILDILAI